MSRGGSVRIASESALIVWDEATKTEHFIRRGSFQTDVPYFGFLVPTPTEPKLGEVPDELFTALEGWTKPEVKIEQRIRYVSLFGVFAVGSTADRSFKHAPQMAAGVEVLHQQRVGNLDATVLKASDKEALQKWLAEHGYDARPQVTDWLDAYIQAGWIITAFQMVKPEKKTPGLDSRAVRMSFQAQQPFYPYREPIDQREGVPPHGSRFLRVFMVADGRMAGELEDKKTPWPGRPVWADRLDDTRREKITGQLGPKADPVKEGAWLTVFEDSSYPRPGTAELVFSKSADESVLHRPPIIHYRYVERIDPMELAGVAAVGGVGVLGGFFVGWRWFRRRD
jgi:hypothetical protein